MNRTLQWIAGAVVVVVAIVAGGWFLAVGPRHDRADKLNAEALSTEQQESSLRTELAMLKTEQASLPATLNKISSFSQKIPAGPSLPTLVRELNAAAASSDVDLQTISPGAAVALVPTGTAHATTGTAGTPTTSGSPSLQTVLQIPVTLNLTGGYFQLEQFVSALEQLNRKFLVAGYALTSSQSNSSNSATTTSSTSVAGSTSKSISLSVQGLVFEAPAALTTSAGTGTSGATSTGTAPSTSTGSAN